MAALAFWIFFAEDQLHGKYVLLTWSIVTPLVLGLGQVALYKLLFWTRVTSKKGLERVVIVGANYVGSRFAREITSVPMHGKKFMGFFEDRVEDRLSDFEREHLIGPTSDLVTFVKENEIDTVYISLPMTGQDRFFNLIGDLQDTTASIFFLPDVFVFDLINARFDTLNGIPIVAVVETPFYGMNALKKRIFDIVVSITSLIVLSPVMLAVAIAIKTTSPGPVIFRQRRFGIQGSIILAYKFRSMRVMEDGEELRQATLDDPRVTAVGKFIRRTSLDELPQFVNVLQGRMSVVGPRPHAVAHNEQYRKLIKGYMIRHKVLPGITGWAQVNGFRGEIKHVRDMEERVNFDLDYLRCWSLSFDFWILLRTFFVVLVGQPKAY